MDVELFLVSALFPALLEFARFVVRRFNAWDASRKTESKAFEAALASDDLAILGGYFRDHFSPIKLATYSSDQDIRKRIDQYLNKVRDYVDASVEDIAALKDAEAEVAAPHEDIQPVPHEFEELPGDVAALKLAVRSIRAGDSWSGLARVRREIERVLRRQVPDAGHMPLVRLAQLVEMPPETMRSFREFSSIANAAVHGSDIGPTDALRALDDARKVFEFLREADRRPVAR